MSTKEKILSYLTQYLHFLVFVLISFTFIWFEPINNLYFVFNFSGNIPPNGYSFMYGYTLFFIVSTIILLLHINKKYIFSYFLSAGTLLFTLYILQFNILQIPDGLYIFIISILLVSLITHTLLTYKKQTLLQKDTSFSQKYSSLFFLHEFKNIPFLSYGLMASSVFVFSLLQYTPNSITTPLKIGEYICPTWFQSCYNLYFLNSSQYTNFSYILFFSLACSFVFAYYKRYNLSHFFLFVPLSWLTILVTLLTHSDYYYGHVTLYVVLTGWVLLLLPNKKTTLGWLLIMTYVLSIGSKITDSWLQGEVFRALELGLPYIGKGFEVFATWTVLLVEGVIVWFLFSKNKILYYGALATLVSFHVYSIALIQYLFPAVAVVFLCIVFLREPGALQWPQKKKHKIILILLTCMFIVGQSVSLITPGDSRYTAEGKRFGLHMFTSLNSCHITVEEKINEDFQIIRSDFDTRLGYCEPYYQWYILKQQCIHSEKNLVLTMDISINNEPFYRTIDSLEVCGSQYHPLQHNSWIKIQNREVINHTEDRKQNIL